MIRHFYVNASDNPAQYAADQIGRQEVTIDWYLEYMIDEPLFRWIDNADDHNGPWRFHYDLPFEPEEMKKKGMRIFVQRKNMPDEWRTIPYSVVKQMQENPTLNALAFLEGKLK